MTLKLAQFFDDPKKISTKSSYPKKIFIFLKTQKNIEIQNFEPKKMGRAYVCVKISEYPPGGTPAHFFFQCVNLVIFKRILLKSSVTQICLGWVCIVIFSSLKSRPTLHFQNV